MEHVGEHVDVAAPWLDHPDDLAGMSAAWTPDDAEPAVSCEMTDPDHNAGDVTANEVARSTGRWLHGAETLWVAVPGADGYRDGRRVSRRTECVIGCRRWAVRARRSR